MLNIVQPSPKGFAGSEAISSAHAKKKSVFPCSDSLWSSCPFSVFNTARDSIFLQKSTHDFEIHSNH